MITSGMQRHMSTEQRYPDTNGGMPRISASKISLDFINSLTKCNDHFEFQSVEDSKQKMPSRPLQIILIRVRKRMLRGVFPLIKSIRKQIKVFSSKKLFTTSSSIP